MKEDAKEDAKEAAKDSGMKKSDAEHGHLTVTEIKMVSDSCKWSINVWGQLNALFRGKSQPLSCGVVFV